MSTPEAAIPFVGIHAEGRETYFCLTTSPGAFPGFDLHGAFRSREVTSEAFFSLMRLLQFVGHPCRGTDAGASDRRLTRTW